MKLLVAEIAAVMTTKLIKLPAPLKPAPIKAWTNGELKVETLFHGRITKIPIIAKT